MENEGKVYQENGITIGQIFNILKKNWILILAITLSFTLAGTIYGLGFKETTYTASADVMVIGRDESSTQSTEYVFSTYLVNTIRPFIVGDKVVGKISESTGISKETLRNNIQVTTSTNSLIINLTYKASTEEEAIKVVNDFVKYSIEVANAVILDANGNPMYNSSGDLVYETAEGFLANTIFELNSATEATGKRGASTVIIVAFAIGLILSFAIIVIKYFMDDTFTSKKELEEACGINVLTLIEDAGSEGEE